MVLGISTNWLVYRLWPVIDAPALLASNLFDLVSVWNVVRELLTLSKQCTASCSSRLAPIFVLGDLVFLTSKVCIYTCVAVAWVHFTLLIKLAWHCTSLNIIVNATFFCVQLWYAFYGLHWSEWTTINHISDATVDTWLNRIGPYPQRLTHFWNVTFLSNSFLNKHMFMNTYLCFPCQIFFDTFSKQSLYLLLLSTFINKCWLEKRKYISLKWGVLFWGGM